MHASAGLGNDGGSSNPDAPMPHPHTVSALPRSRPRAWRGLGLSLLVAAVLAGCGGGDPIPAVTATPTSRLDSVRLANQASFGPTEALVSEIQQKGPVLWVAEQLRLPQQSFYTLGGDGAIHQHTYATELCLVPGQPLGLDPDTCYRNYHSASPLNWDFYRNAAYRQDQLRQRVALALQQIVVVSSLDVNAVYGQRGYHNIFLEQAFGNYREVLRQVARSPVMGEYLDHINNDKAAPNENFARELLQLFTVGTCLLDDGGRLAGGKCSPTFNTTQVRNYAYAMTGWTYPPGGRSRAICQPEGANCRYLEGSMVSLPRLHDTESRELLTGISVPAGSSPESALEAVLDSLMTHPNIAPFICKQLIQHLVTSNPSPEYVQRVVRAFRFGFYAHTVLPPVTFGRGQTGDLLATVAAVLLDPEARTPAATEAGGKLREPALVITGALRALNAKTDGDDLIAWGRQMRQPLFEPPSVFNFYPPDYPVAGGKFVGPTFGILNADALLWRLNFLSSLLEISPFMNIDESIPGSVGTTTYDTAAFDADASDPGALVDRLSLLLLGEPLPAVPRGRVVEAVQAVSVSSANWRTARVREAAYLVMASPQYQVPR